MLLDIQRKKVIEIALEVQRQKLVALTFGNFSLRDNKTGYICVTPSGMKYEELLPEDIVVVDENCNIIDGKRKPSIEAGMHCAVYRRRSDVSGVVHTHSPWATAWACCNQEIPCLLAELAGLVGGPVRCAPYRPMGSKELAEVTAESLKNDDAILMEKHGALSVGTNIDIALNNAIVIEEAAKIAIGAKIIGTLSPLPEQVCKEARQSIIEKYGQ
ncbi:MAG: class II aldolase/adducin family protein [Clostridium sp.]|jgi:L-ribulose-5-phosphate 4-epimerase|uniref:class II aldolase/adducin family protein n=1 Tax=Clostridium sp. TaxID=1506 RepID=UPI0025C5F824|nr:class II aldolase/adducin family protein [Clostridium sp.]MCH3965775.1 class II aldolase/adducin family protein [Clostridium sp.]MCI1717184.1 class II aldolase/adducin family protein [Clostridium sp.]MCI1801524.1 class II aldolase/adducin family protein [Clostridium sp.]MCI1815345.1 class II aldolase/adducin family protein [Clostridium sp.]MCI1872248.1 class II aldolase/adducin family protein [Clostridium sp.]